MACILIVENTQEGELIKRALLAENHAVVLVCHGDTDTLINAVIAELTAKADGFYDFLSLDIAYNDDHVGGIVLYRALIEAGVRRKWKHTLVCTVWGDAEDSPYGRAIEAFMLTAFIPHENLIKKYVGRNVDLLRRIDELMLSNSANNPSVTTVSPW